MKDLFGGDTPYHNEEKNSKKTAWGSLKENPMLKLHGRHPEQKSCKGCIHIYSRSISKNYYKCDLWSKGTASPSDDHKLKWPACNKYQSEQPKSN